MNKQLIKAKLIETLPADGKFKYSYGKFFISFFLSLIFAFLVSNTYDNNKLNNDLKTYSEHFDCLNADLSSVGSCGYKIGYPVDFLYEYFSYGFKFITGLEDFSFFILIYSFIVYFSIIFLTIKLSSSLFLISLAFLLVDFRFYEIGNNVLRNGLALVFMLYLFYFYTQDRINLRFFYRVIPSFAHITALPFIFVLSKPMSLFFYGSALFISLFLGFKLNLIIDYIYPYLPSALQGKLSAYQMLGFHESKIIFEFPVHYVAIFLFGFLFFKKITEKKIIFSFNVCFIFLILALLLNQFGVGYRFLNYMVPFLAIMISYYFWYALKKFNYFVYLSLILIYFMMLFSIFIKNYDFILRGFE